MANEMLNAYPALISNNAVTSPDETNLRKNLMNAYLKQLQGQSVIAPIAQAVDFLGGSYRGGKNAPVGTLSAMTQNPVMKQTANILGWMGKEKASTTNPLQLARFEAQLAERERKAKERKEKKEIGISEFNEKQTEKLSKRMGDTASIASNLKSLYELVPDLEKEDSETPIPGIGVGMSAVPLASLSKEGQEIRQKATSLVRAYIYLRSGKQINETEARDFMRIAGMGWDAPAGSFRTGVNGLRREIEALMGNIQAGYSPDVVKTYKSRGGITKSDIKEILKRKKKDKVSKKQFSEKDLDAILYGE